MDSILNFKFFLLSVLYMSFSALLMVARETSDYVGMLPNTTLAGIGLALAMFGGVLSYFWEKTKRKDASFRNNVTFALGAGIIIGLISYDRLVVQNGMVNSWLGLLTAAGFANQMCMGMIALFARKRLKDLWGGEGEIDGQQPSHDRKRH